MWQQLILCFILIGSSYQITQAEVDVNSHNQADLLWSYLQLRPDDVYITENDITLVTDIATKYYGGASYAPLIFDANPSLDYDENFRILNAGVEITLPSVIRCTEFLPLDCIENSYIVTGLPLSITVTPKPVVSASPIVGRTLQLAGDVDYLEIEDLTQPLMERVHDISSLDLKIGIANQLKVAVWPRDGGASSFIRAGGEISYNRKVSPYDVTSYHFSFTNIFNETYFVEVSVAVAPMPHFPFFGPGEKASIGVKVTNTTNSIYVKTYYTSPKINPTQGQVSLLTQVGQGQPSLNITLSIDAQWGKNTARVILEEYYGDALAGFNNQIRYIVPSKNDLRIEFTNSTRTRTPLVSNATTSRTAQVWRFVRVRGNEYRILNMNTRQAIGVATAGYTFRMENPSTQSSTQVWTLVPTSAARTSYFIQGTDNLCWTLNHQESPFTGTTNVFPLRLLPCDASVKQTFTFPNAVVPTGNAWDWTLQDNL
jgi:hypothetical protein